MISPSDIRQEMFVFVGLSDEHPCRVVGPVETRGGRPYVAIRYIASGARDVVPLTVVRAMGDAEMARVVYPTPPKKRQAKTYLQRRKELLGRPSRQTFCSVSLRDVATEAGLEAELDAALERAGMDGE